MNHVCVAFINNPCRIYTNVQQQREIQRVQMLFCNYCLEIPCSYTVLPSHIHIIIQLMKKYLE